MAPDNSRSERMQDRILSRVEKKLDQGKNFFAARSIMSTLALAMTSSNDRAAIQEVNERIIKLLESKKAEGAVYATREDLGNGEEDTTDYVYVAKRDGVNTGATHIFLEEQPGRTLVVRERTSGFDEAVGI